MAKPPLMSSRETLIALGAFAVGAVLAGGVVAITMSGGATSDTSALRESALAGTNSYRFTDPLIAVSSGADNSPEYASLGEAVSSYIASQSAVTSMSVSFRDIGASLGISLNPDALYSPGSLYKVPLMLAYYKLAQMDPAILSERITYDGTQNLDATENIESNVQLVAGRSYSVEELIEHMVKYSDNNAVVLLKSRLDAEHPTALGDTLSALGVPYGTNEDFLKVGQYSIFFRTLYNATYLTPEYSDKALNLLTETDFTQGIESGVPNSVDVAQKFGDTNDLNAQGTAVGYELHNCGIIYYPKHPYLLCVMSKGKTIGGLEAAIAGVSKMIYQALERRYGND